MLAQLICDESETVNGNGDWSINDFFAQHCSVINTFPFVAECTEDADYVMFNDGHNF